MRRASRTLCGSADGDIGRYIGYLWRGACLQAPTTWGPSLAPRPARPAAVECLQPSAPGDLAMPSLNLTALAQHHAPDRPLP